jgi:Phosphotransferase enzyme family
MQDEELLHGGNTNVVVRVGDTVRRHRDHWTPAVHALLAHLTSVGFTDAPAVLGIDDQGREILPFVIGEVGNFVPDRLPDWFRTIEACMAIGDWLRRFHDAQRGFKPGPDLPWRMVPGRPLTAGEVVVHHDAAPYNTIRRPDGGLTVIDWDFCAPGEPIEDLAFACWSWAPLWNDRAIVEREFGDGSVEASGSRLGALAEAYGLDAEERARLLRVIRAIMHAHANGLEILAAQGDPAFVKLFESGVADNARRDAAWVRENEAMLSAALRGGG